MNFDKLFRKFKRRLLKETVLKAILSGVFLSAVAVFFISLIYHILATEVPGRILQITCPTAFIPGFILSFVHHYPTNKKTAARIDETGLQERVSTMLEFRNQNEEIHRIQRADALTHLNRTKPSRLKFLPFGKKLLLCLIGILAAILITHIPYDIWKSDIIETGITQEQLQIIEDLVAELRGESANLILEPETKDELNRMIAQLEKALKESESDLELVAHIEDARQQTENTLQQYLSLYQIGEALQRYELTHALGEGISFCDGNAVSAALLDLKIALSEDISLITDLSETINAALIDSGVSSEDKLFQALNQFSMDLLAVPGSKDIYPALSQAVKNAEEAILSILTGQAGIESKMNLMDDILAEARDRLLGINPDLPEYQPPQMDMPESSGGEPPEDENQQGQPEGEMPDSENPEDGEGEGGDRPGMIESIYDPVSGNVSYGEVFAVYYSEYLKALEAGNVPPELQKIIDQYFSTLDQ